MNVPLSKRSPSLTAIQSYKDNHQRTNSWQERDEYSPEPTQQKGCALPRVSNPLDRKEFYRRNPHHSSHLCADCKNYRKG